MNAFFAELYSKGDEAQVFYVEGHLNPADEPSRSNRVGEQLTYVEKLNAEIPSLSTFHHPYAKTPTRAWWNV